jgi:hypothetical protein
MGDLHPATNLRQGKKYQLQTDALLFDVGISVAKRSEVSAFVQ